MAGNEEGAPMGGRPLYRLACVSAAAGEDPKDHVGARIHLIHIVAIVAIIGTVAVAITVAILGRHVLEIARDALPDAEIVAASLFAAAFDPAIAIEIAVVPAVAVAIE